MGGRGQASRSLGSSGGGQSLSYKNAVMPQRNDATANYRIKSNRDLSGDRGARGVYGKNAETVYSRNSNGRLLINRSVQSRRRESDRETAREMAREKRRVELERKVWDAAFRNMFSR